MQNILASFISVVALLTLSSCSTMLEMASPNDSSTGYTKTTNQNGDTVYRRDRLVGNNYYYPTPTPTPWPTPYPTPRPPVVIEKQPFVPTQQLETQANANALDTSGAQTNGASSEPSGWGLGVELGANGKHLHTDLHVLKDFGFLEGKIGVALFKGDNNYYGGFDFGLRPKIEFNRFAIYGGIGLYAGDTKHCTTDGYIESCEKKFLTAGYAEAGTYIGALSLFVRSYNINEAGKQIPSNTFYGLGFRTNY